MGTTVIGGMMAASLIGIFFVPAIFYLVEKWSGAGKERIPDRAARNSRAGGGRLKWCTVRMDKRDEQRR